MTWSLLYLEHVHALSLRRVLALPLDRSVSITRLTGPAIGPHHGMGEIGVDPAVRSAGFDVIRVEAEAG